MQTKLFSALKPLIKWSGGKGNEIKFFSHHYPSDFKRYIEPFVGGGSVFFNLNFEKNVIADVHEGLINFYTQIHKGRAKEIYKVASDFEFSEQGYYFVRDELEIENNVIRAARFYYLRKTAFRGMLRYNKQGKFNIPWGRYKTLNLEPILDENYTKLLKNTEICLCSFEELFKRFNSPQNFVFLDPPYDSTFTDYGYCKFGKEYQKSLADIFKKTKNRCLLVIGKTPLIEELYQDYIVESYHKKYGFKIHSGRVGNEINIDHLVIKNY